MKKIIVMLLAMVMLISCLTACSHRKEDESFLTEETLLINPEDFVENTESKATITEFVETITESVETTEVKEETSNNGLDELLSSLYHSDWLYVASNTEATAEQLVEVAKLTAKISTQKADAMEIAVELVRNEHSTREVVVQLAKAYFYDVRAVALASPLADKAILEIFAEEVKKNTSNEEGTLKVANAIARNVNVTNEILETLTESYWHLCSAEAAKSYFANENTLYLVAKRCVKINSEDCKEKAILMAEAVVNNTKVTRAILIQLANSPFEEIHDMAVERIDD